MSIDCSRHCYKRTFIVVISFFFIIIIGFAIVFRMIFVRQQIMEERIGILSQGLDTIAKEEKNIDVGESFFSKEITSLDYREDLWQYISLVEFGVAFFYPQGYRVNILDSFITIVEYPTRENPAPLPAMNIQVFDRKASQSIDHFVYSHFDRATISMIEEKSINGFDGRYVTFHEIEDLYATCGHVILADKNYIFDFSLYECFEWPFFEDIIYSFRKLIDKE